MKTISNRLFRVVLLASAGLAAGISLAIGLQQSVWFDEAYSILLAKQPWTDIVALTAKDVHPPVYYWVLKAWMMLFGSGELALRSMSVVFYFLSIVVSGLLLRKLFGGTTALLALPFIATGPFLLRYGFEIRMYSLASLIGVTATYVLVRAIEEKNKTISRRFFAAYALLVALGVYTLYFMALVWMTHAVWIGWHILKNKRRDLIVPVAASYAAALLLFLPWLPVFLSKAGGGTLSPVTSPLNVDNLIGIVTFSFFYQPPWDLNLMDALRITVIVLLVAALGVIGYKKTTVAERRSLALFGLYFFFPVLILAVVTQFRPIYLERYIAHFVIGGYACLGVLAALVFQRGSLIAKVAPIGLLLVLLAGCASLAEYGNYNFQRVHTPSVKQAATLLGGCKNGDIIFADGPQVGMELGYYVTECPVYFFNETLQMGGGFAPLSGSPLRVADAREQFKDARRILYVYYNKPQRALPESLEVVKVVEMNKLYVATYERTGVH